MCGFHDSEASAFYATGIGNAISLNAISLKAIEGPGGKMKKNHKNTIEGIDKRYLIR